MENKQQKLTISLTNSKLGAQIPSVSTLPACSCRPDAPCRFGCYARKGKYGIGNVQASLRKNYDIYMQNPRSFFEQIQRFLTGGLVTYKYFRWHSAGDIVDAQYFEGMIETARKCPQVKFLCFTKKFSIVNDWISANGELPENLRVVFSAWHKAFKVDNPHGLPVSYVFFKNTELNPDIPDLAIPCTGHCPECLACWSLKNGQSVYFNQH